MFECYLISMNYSLRDEIERLRYEADRIVSTLNDLPKFGEPMEEWETEYRVELVDELAEIEVALEDINCEQGDAYYERMRYGDPSWD